MDTQFEKTQPIPVLTQAVDPVSLEQVKQQARAYMREWRLVLEDTQSALDKQRADYEICRRDFVKTWGEQP